MDHLISAFSRIVRNIDTPATVQELLAHAEADPTSLSAADTDRLLDIPDPKTVNTHMEAITPLSRTALLARARDDPATLTTAETALLARRYWPEDDVHTPAESAARTRAVEAVLALPAGRAQWDDAVERLRRVRTAVRPDEAATLEAAEWEVARRAREARRAARERDSVEGALGRARPWVRRLWEEDLAGADSRRRWGFAVFVQRAGDNGGDGDEEGGGRLEEYRSMRDAMLFHARGATCCGDVIGARWRLQELEWPSSDDEEEGGYAVDRQGSFRRLRKRFAELRNEGEDGSSGLANAVLRNTVCVADRESIASVMAGPGNVDDMWVWALDPECDETKSPVGDGGKEDIETEPHDNDDQSETGYNGYLKVRLQQLVNNFFEARRFQTEDYTMEALWKVAQPSKDQAFVSVRPEEAGQWTVNRTLGSALRPPGS